MNKSPKLMGILNITPDSFYDGGNFLDIKNAKFQIEKMIFEGVNIIDVGGFSSRPGSVMPSVKEELLRIIPILDILDKYNIPLSVDTCRSDVVKELLKYKNLTYINDISGLKDEKILDVISGTNIGYILMHIKGSPDDMQLNPVYDDVIGEIYSFFEKKLKIINKKRISNIILDPGFGFGKSIEDNYEILRNLKVFKKLGYKLLVGLSRKSMIWKPLKSSSDKVLNETVALNLYALEKGCDILRVHDIKNHKNILKIYELLNSNK